MSSTTPGKTKSSLPSTQELNSLPAIQIPENFAPGDSICVLSAIAPGPQLRLLSHLSVELGCSLPLVLLLLCEWGAYIALHPAPSAGTQPGCLFCSPHGPQDQAVHSLPSALGIEQPACVPQGIVSGRPPSLSPLRQFPGLTLRPTSVTTQVTHPELGGRPHAALLRLPSGSVSPPAAQGAICAGPPPPPLPPAPPPCPWRQGWPSWHEDQSLHNVHSVRPEADLGGGMDPAKLFENGQCRFFVAFPGAGDDTAFSRLRSHRCPVRPPGQLVTSGEKPRESSFLEQTLSGGLAGLGGAAGDHSLRSVQPAKKGSLAPWLVGSGHSRLPLGAAACVVPCHPSRES